MTRDTFERLIALTLEACNELMEENSEGDGDQEFYDIASGLGNAASEARLALAHLEHDREVGASQVVADHEDGS